MASGTGRMRLRSSMARLRPAIRSQSAVPPTASRSRASLTRSCSTSRTTQRRSKKAFEPYYRTTILSDETDPNKLHDLKSALDGSEVYDDGQIEQLVALYLGGRI